MATPKQKQANVFDTRVIQRNVGDGSLTDADVKSHLGRLPDVANKAQPFDTTLRGFERDGDDDDHDEQD